MWLPPIMEFVPVDTRRTDDAAASLTASGRRLRLVDESQRSRALLWWLGPDEQIDTLANQGLDDRQ